MTSAEHHHETDQPIGELLARFEGAVKSRTVAPHLAPVAQALDELLSLEAGWNSYGAARIAPEAVEAALALLVGYEGPLPQVVPMTRGGVSLEWCWADGDVSIEVEPDGALYVAFALPGRRGDLAVHCALTYALATGVGR